MIKSKPWNIQPNNTKTIQFVISTYLFKYNNTYYLPTINKQKKNNKKKTNTSAY